MPLTHTRTFRVRHSECDAYGHLNSVNYLRFMQETAFDASAAGGYDLQRYTAMKRYWLIRETDIEYFEPIPYDASVEVKTWISDFRRVTSRRAYEFRRAETGSLCARAFTDWVFLDSETQQPAAIPSALIADFFPEGLPDSFPARSGFLRPPAPPSGIFTTRRRVAWHDLDSMFHVNNAVYMGYASECGFQAITAFGWPWDRFLEQGLAILIRRCQIQYLQPALYDDELEISAWTSNVRRSMATRHYAIRRVRDEALLSQANMLGVWVSTASGKPMRIPSQFLEDFAPNITTEGGEVNLRWGLHRRA